MKILEFKSISPLFEMERDGILPFTFRKVDSKDPRFRSLSHWHHSYNWGLKLINPATGESFIREIKSIDYVRWVDWEIAEDHSRPFWDRMQLFQNWKIIVLGERIDK